MKILRFNERIKKIILFLKLHARIINNFEISIENYKNHENLRIPWENHENIENHRIPCENYEIH